MSHNLNSEDLVTRFSAQVKAVGGYFTSVTSFAEVTEYVGKLALTESSVCKMQIEHGTSLPVNHPAVVLWKQLQSPRN